MATSSLHLHLDSLDRTYLWPIKQLRTSFERTSRRATLSLRCHGKGGWDQVDEEWCLVTNDILTASAFADKLVVLMAEYAVYLNVRARDLRNIIIPARIMRFSKVTFLWNSWEKFSITIFPMEVPYWSHYYKPCLTLIGHACIVERKPSRPLGI